MAFCVSAGSHFEPFWENFDILRLRIALFGMYWRFWTSWVSGVSFLGNVLDMYEMLGFRMPIFGNVFEIWDILDIGRINFVLELRFRAFWLSRISFFERIGHF